MGVAKKAGTTVAKTKAKGTVQNVTEDIPVVGGIVDSNVKAGPMDRAGDALDDTKDKLPGGKKKKKKKKGDGLADKATDAAAEAAGNLNPLKRD